MGCRATSRGSSFEEPTAGAERRYGLRTMEGPGWELPPALMVASAESSAGKTTLVAGLIRALRRTGVVIQPFKAGPDYIDASYHARAAGRPCSNLDLWMCSPDLVGALLAYRAQGASLVLIEGMMGLFDGRHFDSDHASSAHLAKLLQLPLVVCLDLWRSGRTGAAVAKGLVVFDQEVPIAGFLLNRAASPAHGDGVRKAVEQATGLPVLGVLPYEPALQQPERHLGLIPTDEPGPWEDFLERAADWVMAHVDLRALISVAALPRVSDAAWSHLRQLVGRSASASCRIAVARDSAFCFRYPENEDLLRLAGAELVYFSPMASEQVPSDAQWILLAGGFPELYGAQLSVNRALMESLRRSVKEGARIYAECGGLMYLTEAIETASGEHYPMAGLLPGRCRMTQRLSLGYRKVRPAHRCWLGRSDLTACGHEFHYSQWEQPSTIPALWAVLDENGGFWREEGAYVGRVAASYIHLYFWGVPELATQMVEIGQRG
jgi:cobyrinic acid a,c-diamide synthase